MIRVVIFGYTFVRRKRRYVHRCKLDWDVHSSSGRYVRKHCKPLKVSVVVISGTGGAYYTTSFKNRQKMAVLEIFCHHRLKISLFILLNMVYGLHPFLDSIT